MKSSRRSRRYGECWLGKKLAAVRPARRAGNDYLFLTTFGELIENIENARVKTSYRVAAMQRQCLDQDYRPDRGVQKIRRGASAPFGTDRGKCLPKLPVVPSATRFCFFLAATYHDPCYLAEAGNHRDTLGRFCAPQGAIVGNAHQRQEYAMREQAAHNFSSRTTPEARQRRGTNFESLGSRNKGVNGGVACPYCPIHASRCRQHATREISSSWTSRKLSQKASGEKPDDDTKEGNRGGAAFADNERAGQQKQKLAGTRPTPLRDKGRSSRSINGARCL